MVSEEGGDQAGEVFRLVFGDEAVGILDADDAGVGEEVAEAVGVGDREEAVLLGPGDERRSIEGAQAFGGGDGVARGDTAQDFGEVAANAGIAAKRLERCLQDGGVEPTLRQAAENEGETLNRSDGEEARQQRHRTRHPAERLGVAERARQEIVEGVAGREDEPIDAVGMVAGDELTESAAGVVADDGGGGEFEPVEEIHDEAGETGRCEIGVRVHRREMRAEREIWDEAAIGRSQVGNDVAPEVAVVEQTVEKHDRVAASTLTVPEGTRRQLNLPRFTKFQRNRNRRCILPPRDKGAGRSGAMSDKISED